jgi:hypothetical protein
VWFSASIQGDQRTYEIRPQITIPEYRTDAARAIDAYERLMERHMDLTEANLIRLDSNLKSVAKSLDSIDKTLMELSGRIARIEKALGIEQPKTPAKKSQPKTDNKEAPPKSPPSS